MGIELQRGTLLLKELSSLMQGLSDEDVGKLFNESSSTAFLEAIFDVTEYKEYLQLQRFY